MDIITLVSFGAVCYLFPVVLLISRPQPAVFKWLVVCNLLSVSSEAVGLILIFVFKTTPNYAMIAYTIISTSVISLFFYHAINSKKLKTAFLILNFAYLGFALLNAFFIQKLGPNSYSLTIQGLIVLMFCIGFYYKLLKDLPTIKVHLDPLFLIVSGWFFTYAGKLVLNLISEYFITVLQDNMVIMWSIFNVLTIIGNIIVSIGAYLQWKTAKAYINPTKTPAA